MSKLFSDLDSDSSGCAVEKIFEGARLEDFLVPNCSKYITNGEADLEAAIEANLGLHSPKTEFVTTLVGAEAKSYFIHKVAISHYSPFCQVAFESAMVDCQTGTMKLEDVESAVFVLMTSQRGLTGKTVPCFLLMMQNLTLTGRAMLKPYLMSGEILPKRHP